MSSENLGDGISVSDIHEEANKKVFPKQLLLDKLDAADFFNDGMSSLEPLFADSNEANQFRYYFDGFIGSIMSVKAFYRSQDVEPFDRWTDEEWKADLHTFLRTDLRNPIHHPDEWIDKPHTGISRRMVVVNKTVCFAIGDLPVSVSEYFEEDVGFISNSFVSVVDICDTYANLIDRWVKHVEKIERKWFHVPEVGSGEHNDAYRPKYSDREDVAGHAGNKFKDKEPRWVVKFKGTPEALEDIADQGDTELLNDEEVVNLFNQMKSVSNFKSIDEVNDGFGGASRNYGFD